MYVDSAEKINEHLTPIIATGDYWFIVSDQPKIMPFLSKLLADLGFAALVLESLGIEEYGLDNASKHCHWGNIGYFNVKIGQKFHVYYMAFPKKLLKREYLERLLRCFMDMEDFFIPEDRTVIAICRKDQTV